MTGSCGDGQDHHRTARPGDSFERRSPAEEYIADRQAISCSEQQAASGIYLKLHPAGSKARTIAVRTHGILGKSFPIVGWTREYSTLFIESSGPSRLTFDVVGKEMLLGVIAGLDYCLNGETLQCLAHYIMGSAFVSKMSRQTC